MELLRLYLETLLLKFLFYGFHRKDIDYLKFICGYLITLCSIILLLSTSKTSCASKSLVWVWGVTTGLGYTEEGSSSSEPRKVVRFVSAKDDKKLKEVKPEIETPAAIKRTLGA